MTGHNGWAYGWEDRVIKVQGADIKIETQLTDVKTNQPLMLKITYDLNPKNPPIIDDVGETVRVPYRHVCFEADLIDLVHSIGHGPQLLKFTKSKQNEWMPYPGGQINYKVMTRVPGADVDKIRDNLSARERQSIRSQLAKILEAVADKNRVLRTVDLSFLRYLVDLTHWAYQIVQDEITVYSPFVLESGLWTDADLISPGGRETSQEPKKCRIWSYSGSGVKTGLAFSIVFHAACGLRGTKGVDSGESNLAAQFTHKFAASKSSISLLSS
ncbi:Hypothetical protein PENO1_099550 [Penicillium occitanis (nom. inval.)]|nr:Hypothetical protein PENO1_099550 [Penicillium occitanis (nom. inval.)]PCH00821.1 hypothetical protein PENOC_051500 [Penicillium occitanis (nom. inval.)]